MASAAAEPPPAANLTAGRLCPPTAAALPLSNRALQGPAAAHCAAPLHAPAPPPRPALLQQLHDHLLPLQHHISSLMAQLLGDVLLPLSTGLSCTDRLWNSLVRPFLPTPCSSRRQGEAAWRQWWFGKGQARGRLVGRVATALPRAYAAGSRQCIPAHHEVSHVGAAVIKKLADCLKHAVLHTVPPQSLAPAQLRGPLDCAGCLQNVTQRATRGRRLGQLRRSSAA
jgi:hypothetical protein